MTTTMTPPKRIRPAAVAGTFYPADAAELQWFVDTELQAARARLRESLSDSHNARALIGPHAGFIYSGPIAASAYCPFMNGTGGSIKRIAIISPAHRVAVTGMAASSADAFVTPLGFVQVDRDCTGELCEKFDFVNINDEAHAPEHGIETHLPFCQTVFDDFSIVPLAMGDVSPQQVTVVIENLWNDDTLIAISSDLSHFYSYDNARKLDQTTCKAIEEGRPANIGPEQACGRPGVQAIVALAEQHQLRARTLDLRNSGDTAGPRDQVVGYGAWIFG